MLTSHVIAVSASLNIENVIPSTFFGKLLERPRAVEFIHHRSSLIRCDHKLFQEYLDIIKKIKIVNVNLHVPKGLGESENELTDPQHNFRAFQKMMRNLYFIEIPNSSYDGALDISNLIEREEGIVEQSQKKKSTLQDKMKNEMNEEIIKKMKNELQSLSDLVEKKKNGLERFMEFTKTEVQCCICFDSVSTNGNDGLSASMCPVCMNVLHRECNIKWVENCKRNGKRPYCPMCKSEISTSHNQISVIQSSTPEKIDLEQDNKNNDDDESFERITSFVELGEYMIRKITTNPKVDHSLKGRISGVMEILFRFMKKEDCCLKFMFVCKTQQEKNIFSYFENEFRSELSEGVLEIQILKGAGRLHDSLRQRQYIDSFNEKGKLLLLLCFDSASCNSITGLDFGDLNGIISVGSSTDIVNDDQRAGRLIRLPRNHDQNQEKLFINIRSFTGTEIERMKQDSSSSKRYITTLLSLIDAFHPSFPDNHFELATALSMIENGETPSFFSTGIPLSTFTYTS